MSPSRGQHIQIHPHSVTAREGRLGTAAFRIRNKCLRPWQSADSEKLESAAFDQLTAATAKLEAHLLEAVPKTVM